MKILVTGASGFIGSNLVETFLKQGHEVIGIDNDYEKHLHLKDVISNENFKMFWNDIKKMEHIKHHFGKINIIYHMAAASDIKRSSWDTEWDLVENVVGTHHILELMRKENIKRIVFPSTSVVYGENAPRPTPEDCPDRFPISQYAASKIAAEAFIHAYANMYDIKAWIFRFANVMGRHQHRGVVYDFVNKLKNNSKEMEILGDGNQLKSYIHVSDCMAGMFYVVEKDKNKKVSIYNLAVKDQVTVTELADIVCDELGLKPKYKYTGGDRGWAGDMPKISLAVNKIFRTGWRPKMNCKTAIRKTVGEIYDSK